MYPVILKVGPITIYSFGLAIAAAFLAAILITRYETRRRGFSPDIAYDLALWALVGGIIGSRLFYVIGHWDYYSRNLVQALIIQSGGLVWYGGLAGGALAILIFLKRKKLPVATFADIIAPSLAIGAAIGRIGCLLNGCCYGEPTTLPWAINLLGAYRHPTQIYEFFMNLIVFSVVWSMRKRFQIPGMLFWLYLSGYSLGRFGVEFVRVNITVWLGLSASQLISLVLFIVSVTAMFLLRREKVAEK